ncbi:MAG: cytochrome C oxidase Cbb3 [Phenylobacterium sp.]|nr:MAG: cytochrome C oxidase Cbb3 [Phenylobacterium sp.]
MARTRLAALAAIFGLVAAAGVAGPQAFAQPATAADTERGNGQLGALSGEGGDPALGATVYQQRCASCHDTPTGRTPSKAVIGNNTRAHIADTLIEGVMAPMAAGLTTHERSSVAAYLSTRKTGQAGEVGEDAPLCKAKAPPMSLDGPQWNGWGRTDAQSRFQPNPGFSAAEVPRLKLKWAFAYPGARNGQATVVGGRVFVNAFSGSVYALNARTGCAYWRFDAPAGTRASIVVGRLPAAKGGKARYAVYFTDFTKSAYALDAETGALIWRTRVDDQQEVQMTGSPALHDGRLYVTISSAEEAIAADDKYECCKFRGAVVAVDAVTGKLLWKTYVTPGPAKPFKTNTKGVQMYGPAGGAIWSAPTVDPKRGLIYVATGDSYTDVDFPNADAIMALDARTGAVRWSRAFAQGDNYIVGCYGKFGAGANCPRPAGPDVDFGASPILHTLASGKQVILAGQKSSQVYALDPDAQGKVLWEQRLSTGGPLGGVEFGLAADPTTVYAPVSDVFSQTGHPKPQLTAIRIADGKILWTAVSPITPCAWKNPFCSPALSQAVSASPGVVFAGAMNGHFRAFDAATGKIVWDVDTAAPVTTVAGREAKGGVLDGAGPTIAGGMVYVSSGYQGRSGTPGNVLLAYSVDGK